MRKAYFQYYETFETIFEKIKDAEQREIVRKMIVNYGLYGTEPDTFANETIEMAWTICKDLIDQQTHRRRINAENRAGKKAETTEKNSAVEPVQETDEKRTEIKNKKFEKPTVEAIAEYCKAKNYSVNAQQFYSYYESNGWRVGRNPMKSWQATLQNWNTRERANSTGTAWTGKTADADTAGYEDLF